MPDPPQLRQGILPEPAQVRQPESPSDQRLHRHSTRPEPPHVAQRGRASHLDAAGSPSPSDRFAIARPASMPSPADAITTGATILDRISNCPELRFCLDLGWDGMEWNYGRREGEEEECSPWLPFGIDDDATRYSCQLVERKRFGGRVWRRLFGRRRRRFCVGEGGYDGGGGGAVRRLIGFFRWSREGGCVACRLLGAGLGGDFGG